MPEVARGELRADAAEEVDELRALEAALDVELAELEDVRAPVECLGLDVRPRRRWRRDAPGTRLRGDGRAERARAVPTRPRPPAAGFFGVAGVARRVRPWAPAALLLRERSATATMAHERRSGQRDRERRARDDRPIALESTPIDPERPASRREITSSRAAEETGGEVGKRGAAGARRRGGAGALAGAADMYFSASARSG